MHRTIRFATLAVPAAAVAITAYGIATDLQALSCAQPQQVLELELQDVTVDGSKSAQAKQQRGHDLYLRAGYGRAESSADLKAVRGRSDEYQQRLVREDGSGSNDEREDAGQ